MSWTAFGSENIDAAWRWTRTPASQPALPPHAPAHVTTFQVVNAQLFNLSEDPQEQQTLLERGGAGGCCLTTTSPDQSATIITNPDLSAALEVMATLVDGASQVSTSCLAAAATSAPPQGGGGPGGVVQGEGAFLGVCCHLQRAAIAFAGDNLRFFGRQG